jgi:hypothetical protein
MSLSSISAQILERDSIDIDSRYTLIKYTNDVYALGLQNVDTSLNAFHVYNPALQQSFPMAFLSTTGQAAVPLAFDYERKVGFSLGFRQFQPYQIQRKDIRYYRTAFPYTNLMYVLGSNQEQFLKVSFAQPINRNLYYQIDYQMISSPSVFDRQLARHRNFNASTWYNSKNKRYNLLAHFFNNRAIVQQNGGIYTGYTNRNGEAYDAILDTTILSKSRLDTRLSEAETNEVSKEFFVQQSYDWGISRTEAITDSTEKIHFVPTLRLAHQFSYNQQKYDYTDTSPTTVSLDGRWKNYNDFFINQTQTTDSLQAKVFDYEVFIAQIGQKKIDSVNYKSTYFAKIGFRHQLINFEQFETQDSIPTQYITVNETQESIVLDTLYNLQHRNTRLQTGLLNFRFDSNSANQRLQYHLKAQYALWGYNLADFSLEGQAKFVFSEKIGGLKATGKLQNITPDYLTNFYFSNHHRWQNDDFRKINSLQWSVTYFLERLNLAVSYKNYTLNNYIIWNETASPEQLSNIANISQFVAKHHFEWRKWQFNNLLLYQISTNDAIRLPNFYSRHRFFYENSLFKNALVAQLGIDLSYNSNYFANAYAPAIGQFYVQNEQKLTFYPVVDVFLNVKIQKARIFVKMEHLNQGIFRQRGYYVSPNYAMPERLFRIGFSWAFYN